MSVPSVTVIRLGSVQVSDKKILHKTSSEENSRFLDFQCNGLATISESAARHLCANWKIKCCSYIILACRVCASVSSRYSNEKQCFESLSRKLLTQNYTMADTDRVVYPDEVDDVKATAAAVKPENGDSNTVEEAPAEATQPTIQMRNMIVVPPNCPPGYQLDANGVCREVFD